MDDCLPLKSSRGFFHIRWSCLVIYSHKTPRTVAVTTIVLDCLTFAPAHAQSPPGSDLPPSECWVLSCCQTIPAYHQTEGREREYSYKCHCTCNEHTVCTQFYVRVLYIIIVHAMKLYIPYVFYYYSAKLWGGTMSQCHIGVFVLPKTHIQQFKTDPLQPLTIYTVHSRKSGLHTAFSAT